MRHNQQPALFPDLQQQPTETPDARTRRLARERARRYRRRHGAYRYAVEAVAHDAPRKGHGEA